jgi:hypothetical protein
VICGVFYKPMLGHMQRWSISSHSEVLKPPWNAFLKSLAMMQVSRHFFKRLYNKFPYT